MPRKTITATCQFCDTTFQARDRGRNRKPKFCSNACVGKWNALQPGNNWQGGRFTNQQGYVEVWMPEHPNASLRGYVLEHRLVMEAHLGRHLSADELVHHRDVNGPKSDNRIENLQVVTRAEHASIHKRGIPVLNGRWSLKYDACTACGSADRKHFGNGLCTRCYKREYKARHITYS